MTPEERQACQNPKRRSESVHDVTFTVLIVVFITMLFGLRIFHMRDFVGVFIAASVCVPVDALVCLMMRALVSMLITLSRLRVMTLAVMLMVPTHLETAGDDEPNDA